ncbi:MAG: hypothetical protein K6G60_10255, partial [Lachnospiraceae bacterium]|nr:hypothetical protein [Lachnospiraceae bacterium]
MSTVTSPIILDETGNKIFQALENISDALAGKKVQTKFAFHYSENDSSPASVSYPAGYDNSEFTDPFYVDLSTGEPHYGDWASAKANFLFPRSCMLKYDGTVDYYL